MSNNENNLFLFRMESEKKPKQSFKTVVLNPLRGTTHESIRSELENYDYIELTVQAGAGKSIIKAERFEL